MVVADAALAAHLLLQGYGASDDGHGLSITLHVEQIKGHILQTDCQQVTIDNFHLLDRADGLARHLESLLQVALTVVGIGELREVVHHAGVVADAAGGLHSLQAVLHGLVGLLRHVVHLAGDAQIVVGVAVGARQPVGLQGLLDEVLRLVNVAQAEVDDGQIII